MEQRSGQCKEAIEEKWIISNFCAVVEFQRSHGQKVTNKESLKKVQPKYSLEAKIMKLRHGFVGQVLTKSTSMEKHYYDRKN